MEERRIILPKEEEVPPVEGRWLSKKIGFSNSLLSYYCQIVEGGKCTFHSIKVIIT